MTFRKTAALFTLSAVVALSCVAGRLAPPAQAAAAAGRGGGDDWLDKLLGRRKKVEASPVIAWSHASSRPDVAGGPGEGFYVWHDKNTVHVWARGTERRDTEFRGWIEIKDGKIDSLRDEHTERDDEFRQASSRRILFTLTAGREPHGFRFNISGGSRLALQTDANGRRTDRVFFGEAMTDARGNPAQFDLKR